MRILLSIFITSIILWSCKEKKDETVKVIINKERTREDVAKRLAKLTQKTDAEFLNILMSDDSLKVLGKDSVTIMSAIVPNTYEVYKKWTPMRIVKKVVEGEKLFWNETRTAKATALNYTPHQIVTIASIVEEESNNKDDKGKIASVYFNRLKKGMPLGADPTIKYALKNFGLQRLILKDIEQTKNNPYNTYKNKGLPPGPICTPSTATIDAVLNAPITDYLFFVAQPNFSGLSNFTNNDKQHVVNAKAYQKFLDSIKITKANRQ